MNQNVQLHLRFIDGKFIGEWAPWTCATHGIRENHTIEECGSEFYLWRGCYYGCMIHREVLQAYMRSIGINTENYHGREELGSD